MKNLIFAALLVTTSAVASEWFPANVTMDNSPERVMAVIRNELNETIICKGAVQAFTESGNVVEEAVSETIAPNDYGIVHLWAVVYSTRFAGSTSFIQCKILDI